MMEMEWDFIIRLCVAGLCGTVIGLDREYRVKDAGFRTHFLVALGQRADDDRVAVRFRRHPDAYRRGARPSRIAAQVVSGIGFIGAGTIIIHRQLVRGLTTAASLWATAGIGLAAGAHMYIVGGCGYSADALRARSAYAGLWRVGAPQDDGGLFGYEACCGRRDVQRVAEPRICRDLL